MNISKKIIEEVNKYYTEKVLEHGPTPKGVDWNGEHSQQIRFKQLVSLINEEESYKNPSVLDFGCGFGSLLSYFKKNELNLDYIGYDISQEMLKQAKIIFPNDGSWISSLPDNLNVDYVIASGLFNVKQEQSQIEWENYIFNTLDLINKISIKGFSFNILSTYSDVEFMKNYLYYASPELFFKHCKLNYSKQVAILHDYDLYEFTLIIRK
jgi:SAM-dependent methyltransferase